MIINKLYFYDGFYIVNLHCKIWTMTKKYLIETSKIL